MRIAESCVAKTVRLHNLAKELGIPSKSIIDKCRAEGIEIKNHMAAIPIGLAESIKEWFGTGQVATSVEVAEHPDLEKIPKRRVRKSSDEHTDADATDAAHDVEDADGIDTLPPAVEPGAPVLVPEQLIIEKPAAEALPPEPIAPAPISAPPDTLAPAVGPVVPTIAAEPPAPAPVIEMPAAAPPPPPAVKRPAAAAPPPPPPKPIDPVRPAGPQLVPKPAELRGPRVVRMEKPDVLPTPRPRPPGPGGDRFSPAGPATPGTTPPGTIRRKPGLKTKAEEEAEAARRGTRSPRRHGSIDDVVERMREWRDQDLLERKERLASATGHGLRDRRVAEKRRSSGGPVPVVTGQKKSEIEIEAPLLVKDFCAAVGVPYPKLLPKMMEAGKPATLNQSIDAEMAEWLAVSLGLPVRVVKQRSAAEKLEAEVAAQPRERLEPRPPIVAMLGHVDHGKTSLLDAIRRTNVAAGEAGGITQHMSAYRIQTGDWHVTFLDTPGHEAFTSMRARGANLTDVVVLVVAADDGVMPQTVEAINHAKAAGVAIVVALNKIDLPNVDINRIYSQLSEHELVPSEWGGQTDVVKTSATTGLGVQELLAHLSTLTELLELRADPTVPANAIVVEARMREGQGVVAQVLVREGTLKTGQFIVCGGGAGKVRSLIDDKGNRVQEAGPSTPVTVLGLDELPQAGDRLYQVQSLDRAKEIAAEVKTQRRQASLQSVRRTRGLEELLAGATRGEVPILNVILKADVQGSIDALRQKFAEFPAEKARLNLLHWGVGAITEADVRLAQASEAIIIGFTVVAEDRARQLAEQVGVEIRTYRIIYEILEDIQKALEGLLEPIKREEARGRAEVRNIFNVSRVGTVAGCYVVDGIIHRSARVRLVRDGRIVLEGAGLDSLKRFKDDAREVRSGLECGIKIAGFDDVKPGDVIEAYEIVEVAQSL